MTNIGGLSAPAGPRSGGGCLSPPLNGFGFAGGLGCSTVAVAMRSLVFLLAGLLASAGLIHGEIQNSGECPNRNHFDGANHIRKWAGDGPRQRRDSHREHGHLRRLRTVQFLHARRGVEGSRPNLSRCEPLQRRQRNLQHGNKKDPGEHGTDGIRTLFSGR